MLDHHLQRWPKIDNINPTMGQCDMIAVNYIAGSVFNYKQN